MLATLSLSSGTALLLFMAGTEPKPSQYRNLMTASSIPGASSGGGPGLSAADDEEGRLKSLLAAVGSNRQLLRLEDQVMELARHIQATLGEFMIRPAEALDIHGAISAIGVDSLVAIEPHNWFCRSVALGISVLEIVQAESLQGLAWRASGRMMDKLGVEVEAGEEPTQG